MATTNIYLNFNGNCAQAFGFYKSVFGGEFGYVGHFSEIPDSETYKVPEEDKSRIMHMSLPIGSSTLMGADCGGEWISRFQPRNNFSISVTAESKEEADRIFDGLAQGGQATMPMNNTFWGDYFGMLTDQFGINWMISFNAQQ